MNQPLAPQEVAFIVDGKTRLLEVVERIGAPNQVLKSSHGVVTRYHFTDAKYFRADYGWGLRFLIPFLTPDLILGGGGFGTDVFQLTYDERWIVRDHTFALHANSSEFRFWPFEDE
jgi:hypothetical protein